MANGNLQKYVKDNYINVSALARSMGITRQALNNKINGKANLTQADLMLLKDRLRLNDDQFMALFFDHDVDYSDTKEAIS